MDQRQLTDDFIHLRGCFSDRAVENYVDGQDLESARYHFAAGSGFLEQAKSETLESEWHRLMSLVEWHFEKTNAILRRYDC